MAWVFHTPLAGIAEEDINFELHHPSSESELPKSSTGEGCGKQQVFKEAKRQKHVVRKKLSPSPELAFYHCHSGL